MEHKPKWTRLRFSKETETFGCLHGADVYEALSQSLYSHVHGLFPDTVPLTHSRLKAAITDKQQGSSEITLLLLIIQSSRKKHLDFLQFCTWNCKACELVLICKWKVIHTLFNLLKSSRGSYFKALLQGSGRTSNTECFSRLICIWACMETKRKSEICAILVTLKRSKIMTMQELTQHLRGKKPDPE